jgi:hypothetical protein
MVFYTIDHSSGKKYLGFTAGKNVFGIWDNDFYSLKNGAHKCKNLQRFWSSSNVTDWSFNIRYEVNESTLTSTKKRRDLLLYEELEILRLECEVINDDIAPKFPERYYMMFREIQRGAKLKEISDKHGLSLPQISKDNAGIKRRLKKLKDLGAFHQLITFDREPDSVSPEERIFEQIQLGVPFEEIAPRERVLEIERIIGKGMKILLPELVRRRRAKQGFNIDISRGPRRSTCPNGHGKLVDDDEVRFCSVCGWKCIHKTPLKSKGKRGPKRSRCPDCRYNTSIEGDMIYCLACGWNNFSE